jgi:hypothetical protein
MPPRHAQEQKVKVTWASQFLTTARVSVTAVRENAPVLLMTGIAFGGSYGHIAELCGKYGPHGWVQYATAGCVDLLCVIGAEERQRDKRIGRARNGKKVTWPTVILFIGILVTLAANAATANRNFLGYCVAAWPAAALLLAVSILERRASYEIPLRIEHDELQAALQAEQERADMAEAGAEELRRITIEAAAKTEAEIAEARRQAADATARAEEIGRELAEARRGNDDRKRGGNGGGSGGRKRDRETGNEDDAPADLDSEAKVLWYLDKGYSASQAGVRAGLTDSRGRQIARLAREAPKGIDEGASS